MAEFLGLDEMEIYWRRPLSRMEQYYHVLCRRARLRTYAPVAPAAEQVATLQAAPQFESDPAVDAAFARLFPDESHVL